MPLRRLLVALLAVELIAVVFSGRVTRKMPDLEVYWTAAQRAAAAEPLYRDEDGHYQFKYLPSTALLLSPLGLLSLPGAKAAWFYTSAALLVVFVFLSLRLPLRLGRPAWLALAVVVVGMTKFYAHELALGQVNLLFGVVAVSALLALRRGREPGAGVLFALAIAIKPYAALFLPWLAVRGRRAAMLGAGAGLLCILLAPALVYGIGGTVSLHRAWLHTVTTSTAPNLTNADNVSVAAAAVKWLGPGAAAAAVSVAGTLALLLAAAAVVTWRRGIAYPEGLEGALLLTLIPLLSPQGWDYVLLLATPAVVYVATYRDAMPRSLAVAAVAAIAVAGLTIFDVVGRAAYAAFMQASVVTLCYAVVVSALCAIRRRGAA